MFDVDLSELVRRLNAKERSRRKARRSPPVAVSRARSLKAWRTRKLMEKARKQPEVPSSPNQEADNDAGTRRLSVSEQPHMLPHDCV